MDKIKDLYQDDLIYIFTRSQLRDLNTDYLAIIKNECSIQTINNCITMHYQDDFESLLAFSLPTKNRKNKQLILINQRDIFQHVPITSRKPVKPDSKGFPGFFAFWGSSRILANPGAS